MISNLGKKFKGYDWNKNSGYGTKKHLKAIKNLGITIHHRKNFSPINKLTNLTLFLKFKSSKDLIVIDCLNIFCLINGKSFNFLVNLLVLNLF